MAATIKNLWKNEYFQNAIMIILVVGVVFGVWFWSQAVLGTQYPALAVASTSMLPTLNVGDLIIIQRVDVTQIHAQYITGDVIVYRQPYTGTLVVHRAVKIAPKGDGYEITTRGDNNLGDDSPWSSSLLIGKVIAKIPYVGNFSLFIHSQENIYPFLVVIIIFLLIFTMLPFDIGGEEKPAEGEQTRVKRKLFGKIEMNVVYLLILDFLLVVFLVFNLWGVFTFWQLGADPPQDVTIRGMLTDLQYHESFKNVNAVFLSQGLLTYKTDCLVNETIRPGVPTFSWVQASIFILLIINAWKLIDYFMKSRKLVKTRTET